MCKKVLSIYVPLKTLQGRKKVEVKNVKQKGECTIISVLTKGGSFLFQLIAFFELALSCEKLLLSKGL